MAIKKYLGIACVTITLFLLLTGTAGAFNTSALPKGGIWSATVKYSSSLTVYVKGDNRNEKWEISYVLFDKKSKKILKDGPRHQISDGTSTSFNIPHYGKPDDIAITVYVKCLDTGVSSVFSTRKAGTVKAEVAITPSF